VRYLGPGSADYLLSAACGLFFAALKKFSPIGLPNPLCGLSQSAL
jgi:hypothetical protein